MAFESGVVAIDESDHPTSAGNAEMIVLRVFHVHWKYFVTVASHLVTSVVHCVGKSPAAVASREPEEIVEDEDGDEPPAYSRPELRGMIKRKVQCEAMIGFWFSCATPEELADMNM